MFRTQETAWKKALEEHTEWCHWAHTAADEGTPSTGSNSDDPKFQGMVGELKQELADTKKKLREVWFAHFPLSYPHFTRSCSSGEVKDS